MPNPQVPVVEVYRVDGKAITLSFTSSKCESKQKPKIKNNGHASLTGCHGYISACIPPHGVIWRQGKANAHSFIHAYFCIL